MSRAVESVLLQDTSLPFEVIVVNDSGKPLAPAADWQTDARVSIVDTAQVERSAARNSGATLAQHPFLLFLDDDDYLLPGAFAAFANTVKQASDSGDSDQVVCWLGDYLVRTPAGEKESIHPELRGQVTAHLIGGTRFPLGACLIRKSAFWACGGFDPRIACNEDWDLCLRLSLLGIVESVEAMVASFLIEATTSTTAWDTFQETLDFVMEKNLSSGGGAGDSNAFARAVRRCVDPYQRGLAFRAFMRQTLRFGQKKQPRRALACLTDSLWMSGACLATRSFWRAALRRPAISSMTAPKQRLPVHLVFELVSWGLAIS